MSERLQAIVLLMNTLDAGRFLGVGVLCVGARYAAIGAPGGQRIDRRHLSPRQWKDVEAALGIGVGPGPLAKDSPIVVPFTADSASTAVQYLRRDEREIDRPDLAVGWLDGLLHEVLLAATRDTLEKAGFD